MPSGNYDIGCDEGAWNHVTRQLYCGLTDLTFQMSRWATSWSLWLVEWGYGFSVYERLGSSAIEMLRVYNTQIIGPLQLKHMAWFFLMVWVAVVGLRGRLALAASEFLLSCLMALVAATMLANPAGYLRGGFDLMASVSSTFLATSSGQAPPDDPMAAEAVLEPLQAQIHYAFVEAPYDHINWGGTDMPAQCRAARKEILESGPHGSDDEPRRIMDAAGCGDQVAFNEQPSGERLGAAALTLFASLINAIVTGLVSLTAAVAQALLIMLAALAGFAAVGAILPGSGRELGMRWASAVLRCGLVVIGMSFVLAMLLKSVTALLASSSDLALIERFAMVDIVVIVMLVIRKRIVGAGSNLASKLGQQVGSRTAGRGGREAPWTAAPAVAGATGFGIGAAVGSDRPSRTQRMATAAVRNNQANRRMSRMGKAAEKRARTPHAREHTSYEFDAETGDVVAHDTVAIDGPAPRSVRARRARARVEKRAVRRVQRTHKGWEAPAEDDIEESEPAGV